MYTRFVLFIGLCVSALVAVPALLDPEGLLTGVGISAEGASARNEIRAQYGGFYLCLMIALALSLLGRLSERTGLLLLLISVGGVLVGRVFSLLVEGPSAFLGYNTTIQSYFLIDIIIVTLTVLALRSVQARKVQP